MHSLVYQVWGLRLELRATDPIALEHMASLALPDWTPDSGSVDCQFLIVKENDHWCLLRNGKLIDQSLEVLELVQILRGQLHLEISSQAVQGTFIHAGLVGINGTALIIPGRTGVGKSTLVSALVTQGAQFYSDDYAIIDAQGLCHSYPSAGIVRIPGGIQLVPAETMGWRPGLQPLPAGCVVLTHYEDGETWRPQQWGQGQGILGLLENAVRARLDPAGVLSRLAQATQRTTFLRGKRGGADACAQDLLERLTR